MKEIAAKTIAILLFMLWERYLGKTDKIKPSSTLDLIETGLIKIFTLIRGK
jgi:hypothetical protein